MARRPVVLFLCIMLVAVPMVTASHKDGHAPPGGSPEGTRNGGQPEDPGNQGGNEDGNSPSESPSGSNQGDPSGSSDGPQDSSTEDDSGNSGQQDAEPEPQNGPSDNGNPDNQGNPPEHAQGGQDDQDDTAEAETEDNGSEPPGQSGRTPGQGNGAAPGTGNHKTDDDGAAPGPDETQDASKTEDTPATSEPASVTAAPVGFPAAPSSDGVTNNPFDDLPYDDPWADGTLTDAEIELLWLLYDLLYGENVELEGSSGYSKPSGIASASFTTSSLTSALEPHTLKLDPQDPLAGGEGLVRIVVGAMIVAYGAVLVFLAGRSGPPTL